jgi:Zn-dependent M16 (insulinase) family peptidase
MLSPKQGLEELKKQAEKKKLEAYKASLDKKALEGIVAETKELLRRQRIWRTANRAVASIPHIAVSEISKLPEKMNRQVEQIGSSRLFVHQDKCRGIVYTDVYFEPSAKNVREIVLLSLLTNIFGVYGTENYTEEQLANAVRANIGDMEFSVNVYPNVADTGLYVPKICFLNQSAADNMPKAYEISREVLCAQK